MVSHVGSLKDVTGSTTISPSRSHLRKPIDLTFSKWQCNKIQIHSQKCQHDCQTPIKAFLTEVTCSYPSLQLGWPYQTCDTNIETDMQMAGLNNNNNLKHTLLAAPPRVLQISHYALAKRILLHSSFYMEIWLLFLCQQLHPPV